MLARETSHISLVKEKAGFFDNSAAGTWLWAWPKSCQAALQAALLGLCAWSSWWWRQQAVASSTTLDDTNERLFSKLVFIFPVFNRIIKH